MNALEVALKSAERDVRDALKYRDVLRKKLHGAEEHLADAYKREQEACFALRAEIQQRAEK